MHRQWGDHLRIRHASRFIFRNTFPISPLYCRVKRTLHLYKAAEAEAAYALKMDEDPGGNWRAKRGYGSNFVKLWSLDVEGDPVPSLEKIDWEAILDRAIEAYQLSDPVLANFHWPVLQEK